MKGNSGQESSNPENPWRKSSQQVMPFRLPENLHGKYDLFPAHPLGAGMIKDGAYLLATHILEEKVLLVDGDTGVFFESFREKLSAELTKNGKSFRWWPMTALMLPEKEVLQITEPFSGGDDPVFGHRTTLKLNDFFDKAAFSSIHSDPEAVINIYYGTGAALCPIPGYLLYITVPKNEQQFRTRAYSIANLGLNHPLDPKTAYKRFYFIDWVLVRNHLAQIAPRVNIFIDGQQKDHFTWAEGDVIRSGLSELGRNVFRVRPWFEPGVWGGDWCLQNIPDLPKDVPNYAWSFELISPENGLIFESDNLLLEVSFDLLMALEAPNVLGKAFERYGSEFPIRFDFLDTFNGGNLSVQCHPQTEYIKTNFGENFTQEEAYYMLDSGDDAVVYLGFQEGINPKEFEHELTESFATNTPVTIEKYVQKHPSQKHDFFLIPPGTIHASGKNNLVLEISTTPYIFTFKMYDWLRPDLDGKPRPLNIERGMDNLCFERQGDYVKEHLISKPVLLEQEEGWEIYHLPTHPNHSYNVRRIVVNTEITLATSGSCHVFNLVDGSIIHLVTESGVCEDFHYAETFVVPAAAGSLRLINPNPGKPLMLVDAFIKENLTV